MIKNFIEKLKTFRICTVITASFINIKILKKENFYTKEPVKILRVSLFGKVFFYHLTFNRFL